jgi:hypothetical protein
MKKFFRVAFHPEPEPERADTSLRYTDILFGFVIRELFIRLQLWRSLLLPVKLHLVVGTTLVLGSWIGYRRSLHRSGYQVKFFNLPLSRFLIDQMMLVLYFRIAVLTASDGITKFSGHDLAQSTAKLVMNVFGLYWFWDILGIWMAKATKKELDGGKTPLYPKVENSVKTTKCQSVNWIGFAITTCGLAVLAFLWRVAGCLTSNELFFSTTFLLLLYRWAKEIRTSWQLA